MENMLEVKNLKTHFFTRKGVVPAVDGVDLRIEKGQVVGVVGESGCGKSMTAMSIVRLLVHPGKIVEGQILLEGRDLAAASEKGNAGRAGQRYLRHLSGTYDLAQPCAHRGQAGAGGGFAAPKRLQGRGQGAGHKDVPAGGHSRGGRSGTTPILISSPAVCASG